MPSRDSKKTLVLLDMHAVLHRAFHALPSFSSSKGEPTGALYGFCAFILKVIRELKPDYIAAAYDLGEPTFRHVAYEKYKAQRKETESDLSRQIERSYDILKALAVPFYEHKNFEADDVIGTLVEKTKKEKDLEVIIASGDLDTLQLVSGSRVRVYTLRKGLQDTVIYDEKKVEERFGFGPKLLPDFKGLKGDPSDNIIGVPGIGDKTASELIQKFGTLEEIYKILKKDEKLFEKEKVRERIIKLLGEHEEEAFFSKTLGEIRRDAPIDFKLQDSFWTKNYKKERAELLFQELGFLSLISRLPDFGELKDDSARDVKLESATTLPENEKEMWWYFEKDSDELYAVSKTDKIFKFSPDDSKNLREAVEGRENNFYDSKTALHRLSSLGIYPEIKEDLKISAWLSRSHMQNPSVFEATRAFLPKENLGRGPKGELLKTLLLLPKLDAAIRREIKEKKLEKVLYEIELPLIKVLQKMEERGILLDSKFLQNLSKKYGKELGRLEEKIWKLSGLNFNINSPRQLSEVIFGKLNLKSKSRKLTPSGARSTRESELVKMKDLHPVIEEILSYRALMKLKSTYLDALPKLADKAGRLHTTFDQTGTATGRLSSLEPNLQNIPIRTEAGREVRKAFIAPKGFSLAAFDYSQLELRIAAVFSGDKKMKEAFMEGKDIHAATAAEVFNVPESKVTPEMRRYAKVINFGILYGMGINALAAGMEVTRERAREFWEEYFRDFPGIVSYMEETKKKILKNGFVETLFGRRRYIPEIYSKAEFIRGEAERMAINAPIQGTGADIVKLAMIRSEKFIEEKGLGAKAKLLLQIHDELLFEIKSDSLREIIPQLKDILEGVYKGDVPFLADVKVGSSWGEMKKY